MAAALHLLLVICCPSPPSHPNSTPSPTQPLFLFLFLTTQAFPFPDCVVSVSLQVFVGAMDGCRRQCCNFKVFIDVQSPHEAGSCCWRSQSVGVPV